MTRKENITVTRIQTYAPRKTPYFVWDTAAPGLGIKVSPSSHKSWVFQYFVAGGSARITLGTTEKISPQNARRLSVEYQFMVSKGEDPRLVLKERARNAEAARGQSGTLSDLLDKYLSEHCEPKNKPTTLKRTLAAIVIF